MSHDARLSAERASVELRRLDERQVEVDELERWAREESRLNGFSDRMRRGMGGGR